MGVTIQLIDDERVEELALTVTEMEITANVPVTIILTDSDAAGGNPLLIRANACAALALAYPMGAAGALTAINPRLWVVRYEIQKIECDRDTNSDSIIDFAVCRGSIHYSTNSAYRTKWRWSGGLHQIESPYDYNGDLIGSSRTIALPTTQLQFHYERVEASWHWRVLGSAEPSSDPSQPLLRRVGYCMNRVNQVAFLGFGSDVFIMEPIVQNDLPSGDKLTIYTFSYLDYRYADNKYERPGLVRLADGTQREVAGRANFSAILELTWPPEDGGEPL